MTPEIFERLQDFTPEEIVDMLEVSMEDLVERFPERINENQLPWLFDDGV